MTYPRIYYAMAEDKILPKFFMKLNEKTQVQEFSLTFYFLLMAINVFMLGTFEKIINYVMFIDSIALASAAFTVFIFRKKQKDSDYKGYSIKLYPLVPIVFILLILLVSVNVLISDFQSAMMGMIFFVTGYPLFKLMRKIIK